MFPGYVIVPEVAKNTHITVFPSASNGDQIFHEDMYARIGSTVILPCEISKGASTPSWRKGLIVLTQGGEINRHIRGHRRLKVIVDGKIYNLKIYNITDHDFGTYWCEIQQDNSIRAEGTKLINLGIYITEHD